MKKLPNRDEIRDMRFSSLACRVHDWIHSPTRSIVNKSQKAGCELVINLLAAKLADEPDNEARMRVVDRLRKDLDGLMTFADAAKKTAARSQV